MMNSELTEIIWWESSITEHQIHTLSELSHIQNVKLITYVQNFENIDRKKQGWNECDWSLIDVKVIPSSSYSFVINILKNKKNSIHIFGGPFDSLVITFGLFYSNFIGNRTYVLTESFSPLAAELLETGTPMKNWFLKKVRPLKYKILWTLLRRKIEGVFTISPLAIKQLLSFGVDHNKILPFAYFVPPTTSFPIPETVSNHKRINEPLKIIFVGTLNYTKGIDLAINAVNKLSKKKINVTLDVFGPGKDIDKYLWSSNVRYKGVIPFGAAQTKISEYDLLLLPSRYDGWGVVVNESVLAGVPVLCSSHAGAASFIKKWGCGVSYDSLNESLIVKLIADICTNKNIKLNEFSKKIDEARNTILPKNGAEFINKSISTQQFDVLAKESKWYDCV